MERAIYPARKVRADDGMVVLEANDAPDKYVILPKTFIKDIFDQTIYGKWMITEFLL